MSQVDYMKSLHGTAKNGKEFVEFVVGQQDIQVGDEVMVIPPAKYSHIPSRQIGIVEGLGEQYKRDDGLVWQRAYFTRTGK